MYNFCPQSLYGTKVTIILVSKVITDLQKEWLKKLNEGTVKKKDNPQKYSAYKRRTRKRIDDMFKNLLWVAEHSPNTLQDSDWEIAHAEVPLKRRAKALLKALSMFENEPTVLSLIAEIYSEHQIEIVKKSK